MLYRMYQEKPLYDSVHWQQEMDELFDDVEQFMNGEQVEGRRKILTCPDCGHKADYSLITDPEIHCVFCFCKLEPGDESGDDDYEEWSHDPSDPPCPQCQCSTGWVVESGVVLCGYCGWEDR